MSASRTVVVLGATGRLGPAVLRALTPMRLRALSRRAPADEAWPEGVEFVRADRRDVDALRQICDGADAIVDLIGFERAVATALLEAIRSCARRPKHLVFASSVAEYGHRRMGANEDAPRDPDDAYGRGKLEARLVYEAEFDGVVHSLLLPRLVAAVDPGRREWSYLDAARASGAALHAGSGSQRQSIAPVDGVAAVIRALVENPDVMAKGPINVAPPSETVVRDAIAALLAGAGMEPRVSRHPDPNWRGPHGGGDERWDSSRLRQALPGLQWPDVLAVHRELGAWLMAHPPTERPLRVVPLAHKQYRGRRSIDVHGRPERPHVAVPIEALARLAERLTPAFYLDVGRPCNSACIYCAVPPHGDTQGFTPRRELQEQIRLGAALGCARAIFVGGEPSIYPELFETLGDLRAHGFGGGHVMMTNGLKLADRAFVERLAHEGVGTVHLSIDTCDEQVYDALSRSPGRFGQQEIAFANVLRTPSLETYVYAVMTPRTAPIVGSLLAFVAAQARAADRAPPVVVLAFAKPLGDALTHATDVLLDPSLRVDTARDALARAQALGVPVGLRGLQACLAPDLVPYLLDYYLEDYSAEVQTGRREAYAHNTQYVNHVSGCEVCSHRVVCPGVYHEDVRRFGAKAFARDARMLRLPG